MRGVLLKRVRLLPRTHPAPLPSPGPRPFPAPRPSHVSNARMPGPLFAANAWTKKYAMMA